MEKGKKVVFLGGTCNDSDWRDELMPILAKFGVTWFNPVVDDWTEECYQKELEERENCDYCLYHITPKMTGTYSIAEVIDDSNKRPEKTVFSYQFKDGDLEFTTGQAKSLDAVGRMVERNGGHYVKGAQNVLDVIHNDTTGEATERR